MSSIGKQSELVGYRHDIDVMRAIAVIFVVVFHVDKNWLSGGFVGVDVFFVISGYLITKNMISQRERSGFNYIQFYVRRARRLFPAAFATILLTFFMGAIWFSPEHFQALSETVIYSLLSVSNVLFWMGAGYFDTSSEFNPLLHTWSLSVEEQFYLLWPLVVGLAVGMKSNGRMLICFLVILTVSLLIAEYAIGKDVSAAFFLMPFRIAEFSIGALCVVARRFELPFSQGKKYGLHFWVYSCGALLVIYSATSFSPETRFPGVSSMLPCIGAAFMIFSGDKVELSFAVRNKVLVGIGLISYSLYLVHWPVIVFYKYHNFGGLSLPEKVLLLVVSIACAFLLYVLVEKPFRSKWSENSEKPLNVALSCIFLILLLSTPAALAFSNKGWEWRIPTVLKDVLADSRQAKIASINATKLTCSLDEGRNSVEWWQECLSEKLKTKEGYLVIGDSHGRDTWQALRLAYPGENIQMLYQSSCLPFEYSRPGRSDCFPGMQKFIKDYLPALKVKGVFLSSHFATNMDAQVESTVRAIKDSGIPVALFGPTIKFKEHVPKIVLNHGRVSGLVDRVNDLQVEGIYDKQELMRSLASSLGVPFISKLEILCPDRVCLVIVPSESALLSFDDAHWTPKAQQFVANEIARKRPLIEMVFKDY